MTLQDISDISQAVAAVAVLVSLVFVGLQLRMNAEQQKEANILARIQISEHITSQINAPTSRLMDRDFAKIFRKVMFDKTELAPVEVTQILTYFGLCLRAHSLAYAAVEHGLADRQDLDTLESNIVWHLTAPLFADEWRRVQRLGLFPDAFAEHLNRCVAELHPGHATLADPQAPETTSIPRSARV